MASGMKDQTGDLPHHCKCQTPNKAAWVQLSSKLTFNFPSNFTFNMYVLIMIILQVCYKLQTKVHKIWMDVIGMSDR